MVENKNNYLSDGEQQNFRTHSLALLMQYYECLHGAEEWFEEAVGLRRGTGRTFI